MLIGDGGKVNELSSIVGEFELLFQEIPRLDHLDGRVVQLVPHHHPRVDHCDYFSVNDVFVPLLPDLWMMDSPHHFWYIGALVENDFRDNDGLLCRQIRSCELEILLERGLVHLRVPLPVVLTRLYLLVELYQTLLCQTQVQLVLVLVLSVDVWILVLKVRDVT